MINSANDPVAYPRRSRILLGGAIRGPGSINNLPTDEPEARRSYLLKRPIEAGELKSVIDHRFPLEKTAKVHRYFETEKMKGSVVISVAK